MRYLLVVAHPDDEALGAGASMRKWSNNGDTVEVCIMCTEAKARAFRPADEELNDDMDASTKLLGVSKKYEGTFPNIEMNTVPHLKLVQFIEKAILESQPDIIITHHPADTNNDHVMTSYAAQAAARLFQRRDDVPDLKELLFMEVPSSTEWSLDSSSNDFRANTYFEIGREGLNVKLKALAAYKGVMRPYPHPRSNEALEGLAAYRGAQAGCKYAEAFESVLRRVI